MNHRKGPGRRQRRDTDPPAVVRLRRAGSGWLVAAALLVAGAAALSVRVVTTWGLPGTGAQALTVVAELGVAAAAVWQWHVNRGTARELSRLRYRANAATATFPTLASGPTSISTYTVPGQREGDS